MSLSVAKKARLRRELGLSQSELSSETIDDITVEVEEDYPPATYSASVIFAAIRWQIAKDLYAEASRRYTYKEGDSQDNLSDLSKSLKKMVDFFKAELDDLVSAETPSLPPVIWGGLGSASSRKAEWPDA